MSDTAKPVAIDAKSLPEADVRVYPGPYRDYIAGRHRRRLGEAFGLTNFGVNLTRLQPGARSSLRHWHSKQDELIYVVEGELVLITDAGRTLLRAGMIAGWKAGSDNAHQLVNESGADALYLEIGDRTPNDDVVYPEADLFATWRDGVRVWLKKDGTPW